MVDLGFLQTVLYENQKEILRFQLDTFPKLLVLYTNDYLLVFQYDLFSISQQFHQMVLELCVRHLLFSFVCYALISHQQYVAGPLRFRAGKF
jgi:hypothetical protein